MLEARTNSFILHHRYGVTTRLTYNIEHLLQTRSDPRPEKAYNQVASFHNAGQFILMMADSLAVSGGNSTIFQNPGLKLCVSPRISLP